MTRVHVFCEGQTEETFVREVLYEGLQRVGVFLNPILVGTSPAGKGGLTKYAKIRPQLVRKCREDTSAFVTTMFDLFRLPGDFPGMDTPSATSDPLERAAHMEQELARDVGETNLVPNLLVHEFEGLLFTDASVFAPWFGAAAAQALEEMREAFPSPEHIDDGPQTAPSKRILSKCPSYNKPLHGSVLAIDIGLDRIRDQCRHFDAWVGRLADL